MAGEPVPNAESVSTDRLAPHHVDKAATGSVLRVVLRRALWVYQLAGGLDHFLFFHILGIIIPTDFHIFSEG